MCTFDPIWSPLRLWKIIYSTRELFPATCHYAQSSQESIGPLHSLLILCHSVLVPKHALAKCVSLLTDRCLQCFELELAKFCQTSSVTCQQWSCVHCNFLTVTWSTTNLWCRHCEVNCNGLAEFGLLHLYGFPETRLHCAGWHLLHQDRANPTPLLTLFCPLHDLWHTTPPPQAHQSLHSTLLRLQFYSQPPWATFRPALTISRSCVLVAIAPTATNCAWNVCQVISFWR